MNKLPKILKQITTHEGKRIHWADLNGDGLEYIGISKNGAVYAVSASSLRRKMFIVETNKNGKWESHELNGRKSK